MGRRVHSISSDGHVYQITYLKSGESHRRSKKKCIWYRKISDSCINPRRGARRCVVRCCLHYEERDTAE